MARFRIGDRIKVNVTIGSIYDKAGTITGYAQAQHVTAGQLYSSPNWSVQLDDGEVISINERYLNPDKESK